jgi:hypothetical protein
LELVDLELELLLADEPLFAEEELDFAAELTELVDALF